MPRYYEIELAFRECLCYDNKLRAVTTYDFLEALKRYNWHWTPEQANSWIMRKGVYRDVSTGSGDNREYHLFANCSGY